MRGALGILFWLAILAVPSTVYWNPSISVRFSEAEVQSLVDTKLPFRGSKRGIEFAVEKGAIVEFREDERIGIAANFVAKPEITRETRFEGHLVAGARLIYEDGRFFARDVTIEELSGAPVLSERAERLGALVERAVNAVDRLTGGEGTDLETLLSIDALGPKASEFLKERIERMALFEIDNAPFWAQLAGSALGDLSVEDSSIVADIELGTLVTHFLLIVAGIIVIGLIVYAFVSGGFEFFFELIFFGLFD